MNPDRHRGGTERRLALGGCLILGVLGCGAIALLYGTGAALVALGIVAGIAAIGVALWLLTLVMERLGR